MNTERTLVASEGMRHDEGGWPVNIDHTEISETSKWRKKQDKDEDFKQAVKTLIDSVKAPVDRNNIIDLFEE